MRILVVFILLAFGLVTEGKTQRLNDAKTQSKDSATLCLCDSASYYESQIRIADSLYKNYLPQYNFEEVKAAMEFFDRLGYQRQQTTVNRQQTLCTEFFQTKDKEQCAQCLSLSKALFYNLRISELQNLKKILKF